jgi:hypothetical protein
LAILSLNGRVGQEPASNSSTIAASNSTMPSAHPNAGKAPNASGRVAAPGRAGAHQADLARCQRLAQ